MKPPIIVSIEKETGVSLTAFAGNNLADIILYRNRYTYRADENDNITALNLCGKWEDDKQPESPNEVKITSTQLQFLSDAKAKSQLQYLNLSSNAIETITLHTPRLRHLDLSENPLRELSFTQKDEELPDLNYIDLNECKLTQLQLPPLPALQYLDIARNKVLQKIAFSGACPQVHTIDASDNDLQELLLPEGSTGQLQYVYLKGNKNMASPPPETINHGMEAVVRYYKRFEKGKRKKLCEAKLLIVGEARVGKTSLVEKILNKNATLPAEEHSTRGIDVRDFEFKSEGETYTVHIWDFGGQQIYRSTHNLFLTNRSLYVLVDDSSRDDTRLSYWLQKIERLAGKETTTLLVQNQRHKRQKPIDERGLWGEFNQLHYAQPFLFDFSCPTEADKEGLNRLMRQIKKNITDLPIVGTELLLSWVEVREQLSKLEKEKPYISREKLHDLCKKKNITKTDDLRDLSQLFHDLGIILHFHEDAVLKHLVILQKEWATDAIYCVLDDTTIANKKKGRFCKSDLERIWQEDNNLSRQSNYKTPDYLSHIDELLAIMLKFELCYERTDQKDEYVIPQMLPASQPDYNWNKDSNLQLQYDYGTFMPEGILHRLIVRMHRFVINLEEAWARGCILYDNISKAEILEPYKENRITIRASGPQAKSLLTKIAYELDNINESYGKEGLKPDKLVPCICYTCKTLTVPHFYKYAELLRRKERGKETIGCAISFEDVNVQQLIDEVFDNSKTKPSKIFISYSEADKTHFICLKKHFSIFERNGSLSISSSSNIPLGKVKQDTIREEMKTADIILLLMSPDYLDDDDIWNLQIPIALNQHKNKQSSVVPIIVRPCDWKDKTIPFADLKCLPKNETPVSMHPDTDSVWLEIVSELKKLLKL